MVESQWQAIDTAPKDGTTVLLFLPNSATNDIVFGYWAEDCYPGGGVWYEQNGSDSAFPIDVDATHWMPLPAPPATSAYLNAPHRSPAEAVAEKALYLIAYTSPNLRARTIADKALADIEELRR